MVENIQKEFDIKSDVGRAFCDGVKVTVSRLTGSVTVTFQEVENGNWLILEMDNMRESKPGNIVQKKEEEAKKLFVCLATLSPGEGCMEPLVVMPKKEDVLPLPSFALDSASCLKGMRPI